MQGTPCCARMALLASSGVLHVLHVYVYLGVGVHVNASELLPRLVVWAHSWVCPLHQLPTLPWPFRLHSLHHANVRRQRACTGVLPRERRAWWHLHAAPKPHVRQLRVLRQADERRRTRGNMEAKGRYRSGGASRNEPSRLSELG